MIVLFGLLGVWVECVECCSDGIWVVDVIIDELMVVVCLLCGGGFDISEGICGYFIERFILW